MEKRILGIDTGTNSIGWAIVDYDCEAEGDKYKLVDKGVHIFQEGVEEGSETSRAAERTGYRRQRIGYWRRKIRKIALLRILIENELCPALTSEELRQWRLNGKYPRGREDEFMLWLRTDDSDKSTIPYYCRDLCVSEKLDLSRKDHRYILGRALYHINQRRGFLSNRKEDTKESDGTVKHDIDEITKQMKEGGFEYLGQYFWHLYQQNGKQGDEQGDEQGDQHSGKAKIRTRHTSRLEHYEKELLRICEVQGLSKELTQRLHKVIITQRPLKSQKHTVGKCVFEPKKTRCPMSHPLFEQYRMYQFINSIGVQYTEVDSRQSTAKKKQKIIPLTAKEKQWIIPLFMRKSKAVFNFSDIAGKLARKGKKNDDGWKFNYSDDFSVSGCPVTARLSEVFGVESSNPDAWIDAACEVYTDNVNKKNRTNKTRYEIMNDVWHVLFFFEDENKLKEFGKEKLQLDEEHAEMLSKIHVPSGYASLSLKAIRKILPYMKEYGMIYSHAVFMANLSSVIPCKADSDELLPMLPREDADQLVSEFLNCNPKQTSETRDEYIKRCIALHYHLNPDSDEGRQRLSKLYHPSQIEVFRKVPEPEEGKCYQLGSPRTGSIRNPMAMRSLFRIRHVVNTLLSEGKIDKDTTIRIEFARELNDANKRAAIRQWQNNRETDRKEYVKRIKEEMGESYEPTPTDILKYRLWEEQKYTCLYTGKKINLCDLFDSNKFDIEHTIPRSAGGDSTEMNLTLCENYFNRHTKQAQLPKQLANYNAIMAHVEECKWKAKMENAYKNMQRHKRNARWKTDKKKRDEEIQQMHIASFEYNYWKGKYDRFLMVEVPTGFSRRQGVDISIISKYARLYLKSLFPEVYIVKGIATSDFRKIWGLQEEYEKKNRDNHCHHAIDAITIACIGPNEYAKLAQYYHDEERYRWGMSNKRAVFPKPWGTFTEDVKRIEETLLVSHYTADNMGKQTRKELKDKQTRKELKDEQGKLKKKYAKCDTARASLHKDTYYGAIKQGEEIRYVVRKTLHKVQDRDVASVIRNIVDDEVRKKVQDAIATHGSLKKACNAGIWMNEKKGIMIKKVRVYAHDTDPMHFQEHRDKSRFEYKRPYYVTNDSNYVMGIYVGKDKNGKEDRQFKLVSNLEAAAIINKGAGTKKQLLPPESEKHYALKWSLKVGTMLLLYEKSPDEIFSLLKDGDEESRKEREHELSKRLYKIYGMDKSGIIKLVYHQEARPHKETSHENGRYIQGEKHRPRIWMRSSYINALVEDYDFTMNELGEITFLNR